MPNFVGLAVTADYPNVQELHITTIEQIQEAVGGHFTIVNLYPNFEGVRRHVTVFAADVLGPAAKMNFIASALGRATAYGPIFGDVVFAGGADNEGETLDIDVIVRAAITTVAKNIRDVADQRMATMVARLDRQLYQSHPSLANDPRTS